MHSDHCNLVSTRVLQSASRGRTLHGSTMAPTAALTTHAHTSASVKSLLLSTQPQPASMPVPSH